MAVLGSRDNFNRDPRRLMATSAIDSRVGWLEGTGTNRFSNDAAFWASDLITNTNSAFVANTEKTIVNVSGSSGFLTHVIGPNRTAGGTTYSITVKITVDGLLTTLVLNTAGWNVNNVTSENRLYLGTLFRATDVNINSTNRYMGNGLSPPTYVGAANNAATNVNDSHSWVQQYTNYFSIAYSPMLKIHSPQSCVRFENSLNVTITSSYAQSATNDENAGVIYLLDYPSS